MTGSYPCIAPGVHKEFGAWHENYGFHHYECLLLILGDFLTHVSFRIG